MTERRDATDEELVASIAEASQAQWRTLDELVGVIEGHVVSSHTTHPPELRPDGVSTFGWIEYGDEVVRIIEITHDMGIVSPLFDWPSWYQPDRYPDVGSLDRAEPADLIRLATAIIRGDRFNEGLVAEYLNNGILTGVLRRLVDEFGARP